MGQQSHRSAAGGTVVGNVYDKYSTRNPVAARLVENFLSTLQGLIQSLEIACILEAGCGEGHLATRMSQWKSCPVVGVDLDPDIFDPERTIGGQAPDLLVQSVYKLGFAARSFDLVVAAEVLEHLDDPRRGLREIERVSRDYLLISVPREPLWRGLNLLRGAYWPSWGNTPGHLQHWSSRQFVALISEYFDIVSVARPLPWTMVLARRRSP